MSTKLLLTKEDQLAILKPLTSADVSADESIALLFATVHTILEAKIKQEREEIVKEIKIAYDYPCSCTNRQEVCVHNFSQMLLFINLITARNEKDIRS